MPEFSLRDYLDIEATVANEEEEEEEEEDLDDFFVNDDADSTSESPFARDTSPALTDFAQEASEIRARFATRPTGASVDDEALLYYFVPRVSDPSMWSVRVKPGYESDVVLRIAHRTNLCDSRPSADITSVFAREGIPGHVFVEGELPQVTRAVRGVYNVFNNVPPRLVPLEHRCALLAPRSPLSGPIEVGRWVRCLHGMYRNDIGFVCGHNPYQDAGTAVALVPRIPEKTDQTAKRKRGSRPEPRSWSCEQLEVAWGTSQVRRLEGSEFLFRGRNYDSGLVIMILPAASLVKIDSAPNDLRPFLRAPFIRDMPTFMPWVHRFAQDSIKPGHWVKVESGDHRGAIGKPLDVVDSVATLVLQTTGDGPMVLISLRALAPLYRCGDNVKCRWSKSCGLVTSVDEVEMTLTYVEKDSNILISLPVDAVEPHDPPAKKFILTTGTWVKFTSQGEGDQRKRRGYVKFLEGTHATVFDEHSFAEFQIETRELEVSSTQGPSLPKNDPVHPLTGQRIMIVGGPHKGLYANVKSVGATDITVEVTALLVGASSSTQTIKWRELMIVSKELEISRMNPPERQYTPPPGTPPRDSTPDPSGHWLFTSLVQSIVECKCIPFIIRGSGNHTLDAYDGKPARTVPIDKRTLTPREGETIVRTIRRSRPQQISVNPSYLVPWDPVVGGEVLVTSGLWFGLIGIVKGEQGNGWVVSITLDDVARDVIFASKELAVLEPLKQ